MRNRDATKRQGNITYSDGGEHPRPTSTTGDAVLSRIASCSEKYSLLQLTNLTSQKMVVVRATGKPYSENRGIK
jgi:hypothetical protein